MSGLLVLGTLGCGKVSGDHSKVVASVGGEKITEKEFSNTVRTLVGDEAKAKELLSNDAAKEQRNQILGQMVNQKALLRLAKAEGLDKDPKIKLSVDAAIAQVYYQALIDRRSAATEPTEAQLKALYDEVAKQREQSGQTGALPPYETVKAQLPAVWKRKQGQEASEMLLGQLAEKYPVVFAPEYRPVQGRF